MNVVRFCRQNQYAVYLLTAFLMAGGLLRCSPCPATFIRN